MSPSFRPCASRRPRWFALCAVLALLLSSGCDEGNDGPEDLDNDGFSADVDCDDLDLSVGPGMGEICDDKDNDCDGVVDEGYDEDGDGSPSCGNNPDCNDSDADIYPSAEEVCDHKDNDCNGLVDDGDEGDADGDGYCGSLDCDDTNAAISPDASEECDGVDNNCDGVTDEGFDEDGDGYAYCNQGGDCNDQDAAIHPAAEEICNGADEDCDALIDEDFDVDGDGWSSCSEPVDCDDNDATSYPTAPELCDSADNDCDGTTDEDTAVDGDGDGYSACNGDCDDGNPAVFPGGSEFPDGQDNDCNGSTDEGYGTSLSASWLYPRASGTTVQARLGDAISRGGQFADSTHLDFVAGSPLYDNQKGQIQVFLGESFLVGNPPSSLSPDLTLVGTVPGDALGYSLDLADVNDDGYDDLIVGEPQIWSASPPAGGVYVFFGRASLTGSWNLGMANITITGDFSTEQCGTQVAGLGDVNGDGVGDFGFTCPWYNPAEGMVGRVGIVFGDSAWDASTWTSMGSEGADLLISGTAADARSGSDSSPTLQLEGDFDLNGDGTMDFAIGSPYWSSSSGRVLLALGGVDLATGSVTFDDLDRSWTGSGPSVRAGTWLGSGDADGNEMHALFVGVPGAQAAKGVICRIAGTATPVVSTALWGACPIGFVGSAATEPVGEAAAITDLDGDGQADLLIGVAGYDTPGGDQGRVSIFWGPLTNYSSAGVDTASSHVVGGAEGDAFGSVLRPITNFNGDGSNAVLISAPFADDGASSGGTVYYLPGL